MGDEGGSSCTPSKEFENDSASMNPLDHKCTEGMRGVRGYDIGTPKANFSKIYI
jgi:hypothetical protein